VAKSAEAEMSTQLSATQRQSLSGDLSGFLAIHPQTLAAFLPRDAL